MTSERYRESRNMSRPLPSRATKRARPCLSNSFYEASRPTEGVEGHPVDVVIDRLPKVASLCRRLLRLAKRWQGEVSDAQAFLVQPRVGDCDPPMAFNSCATERE